MPRVVACPEKFLGTASAREVAAAIGRAAALAGWTCDEAPLADGGEGILEALGGRPRFARVCGPLGARVDAEWRLEGTSAVIEMARASGLALAGGREGNDPMRATTAGTGELIRAAVLAGARRIVVGMGGSATTDGGLAALRSLHPHGRLHGVELMVACDTTTRFVDAAVTFSPDKGATPTQVELLSRRLERLAQLYQSDHGVDVRPLVGGGAAGGLAGGLAAIGGRLVPGFELVAEAVDLAGRMAGADLVVTGEGFVDEQSFQGNVVGGVLGLAAEIGVPVVVLAGDIDAGLADGDSGAGARPRASYVSLLERFGRQRAATDTLSCIEQVVAEWLGDG
jgi:glycerate 2-kinase